MGYPERSGALSYLLKKPPRAHADGSSDFSRGLGLVAFDVGLNIGEVPYGLASPDYSHEGAGTLRFLPQDLSQGSTFS